MNDGLAVRIGEPLARHTALRTGGPCEVWVVVHRTESLATVVADCREVGWKWTLFGAGTRTVVRDGPYPGVVLRLGVDFSRLVRLEDGFEVGAAVPMPALVAAAAAAGFTGLEPFADVQGSVGASLALDSGWDALVGSVRVLHRGKIRDADYADVQGRNRVIVGARLLLRADDPVAVRRRMNKHIHQHPPGSWYHPLKRRSLRKLMRSTELPMVRLRRVAIPDASPEILVNLGGGSAADLGLLHKSATDRVRKTRGADLDSRIRWIGTKIAVDDPIPPPVPPSSPERT